MRRLVFLAGIALVTVGAVGIVAYLAAPDSPDSGGPPAQPRPSLPLDSPDAGGSAAQPSPSPRLTLTEDERQQALDLALGDSRIKALLAGKKYTVESVAMWGGNLEKVIGAGITFALDQPMSYPETDWPEISGVDPQDPTSFTTKTTRYAVPFATEIQVFVSFTQGVVDFQTSFEYRELLGATPQIPPQDSD